MVRSRARAAQTALLLALAALALAPAAAADPTPGTKVFDYPRHSGEATHEPHDDEHGSTLRTDNFSVVGHSDLGALDTNGDVWVHGSSAYVGTWSLPCSGLGAKVVDVRDTSNPRLIGRIGARAGTSAEDIVVRRVSTPFFSGDLLALGIQRCGDDPALDEQSFGVEFWDVTNPFSPRKLSELNVTNGGGGVHELDLVQRGNNVYALLATNFSEWFDPVAPGGDFRIADATNPRAPLQVGEWGAGAHGFSPGPFWGQGSFGATYGHSARASDDGMKAYVSYWDLGVLTLDISDVTSPELLTRTMFSPDDDGDAHSMTPYTVRGRTFILQNDEDFDPRSPAHIRFGASGFGRATESPGGSALWLEPNHRVSGGVVRAANEGCAASDYPVSTAGRIAVVRTLVDEEPACLQQDQDAAAEAAGAIAVVHDFISETTSPQWFEFGEVGIPVLFTDHDTAVGMVAAGAAVLEALPPTWGYLRVFDAETGRQVTSFAGLPHVQELPAPAGDWTIHNTETRGTHAYSSWYSHGIVALDISGLGRGFAMTPRLVGQFVPEAGEPTTPALHSVPEVWGVAVREDGLVFASDMLSGLWIVEPEGPARSRPPIR